MVERISSDQFFHHCTARYRVGHGSLVGKLIEWRGNLLCPYCRLVWTKTGETVTMRDPFGAVVILSGGLDSTTCMAVAKADGANPIYALTFNYGQRHDREVKSAARVAEFYRSQHTVLSLPLHQWGGSALTDSRMQVPVARGLKEMAAEIPSTYVPGRNLIFLAIAASFAEAHGISDIYFGATQIDYSGYPDCRREFLDALQKVLLVGTKLGVEDDREWHIHTPLLMLGKKAIIKRGLDLEAPYHLTWSCYQGLDRPCGECDSCKLRAAGFAELGVVDPALLNG